MARPGACRRTGRRGGATAADRGTGHSGPAAHSTPALRRRVARRLPVRRTGDGRRRARRPTGRPDRGPGFGPPTRRGAGRAGDLVRNVPSPAGAGAVGAARGDRPEPRRPYRSGRCRPRRPRRHHTGRRRALGCGQVPAGRARRATGRPGLRRGAPRRGAAARTGPTHTAARDRLRLRTPRPARRDHRGHDRLRPPATAPGPGPGGRPYRPRRRLRTPSPAWLRDPLRRGPSVGR